MNRAALWIGSSLLLALGLVGLWLGIQPGYQSYGTRLITPKPAYDFNLIGPQSQSIRLSDFRGKVVLVFFGYTHCPDVCPLTMLELSKIYQALTSQEQTRVQVLMITTDPKRDTTAVVSRYVAAFNPSFIGLTGSASVIAKTAQAYWVGYYTLKATSPQQYEIAHNADVFLINPQGRLELIYTKDKTAQTARVVRDVRWILAGR
ncbi:MAG: SCO family protein [Thermaceae bacterium]|nr:SCO family protein [Thermaceae bacterium]